MTEATTYYWADVELGPAPVNAADSGADAEVHLAQNAPNPFRAQTEIRFSLPAAGDVQLHVYNALGQQVATLVEGPMAVGDHAVTLDGSDLASGTYVYRLASGSEVTTRSVVVVR